MPGQLLPKVSDEYDDSNRPFLTNIKDHVVQLEVLALAGILLTALVAAQPALAAYLTPEVAFLFPFAFIALIPIFVRVTNQESRLRSRLTWGLSGAGVGGTIGGAIAGTFAGGLAAPAGALVGAPIGFVLGAIVGPSIDTAPAVMTQGQAREYLIRAARRFPDLSASIVVDATAHPPLTPNCAVYMFFSDGIIKCTRQDLDAWLRTGCWRHRNVQDGVRRIRR